MSTNPYAPPKSPVDQAMPHEAAPPLWNPSAAARWSLLFTPIFGAWLHAKNWSALGEKEKAAQSKNWAIGCLLATIGIGVFAGFLPDSRLIDAASRGANIGLLVAWYFANARPQIEHISRKFGTTYARRGWGKPIAYAVAAMLAFFICVVVLVVVTSPSDVGAELTPQ